MLPVQVCLAPRAGPDDTETMPQPRMPDAAVEPKLSGPESAPSQEAGAGRQVAAKRVSIRETGARANLLPVPMITHDHHQHQQSLACARSLCARLPVLSFVRPAAGPS